LLNPFIACLPINKRPERWKEYVGFEIHGGVKNKKGDIYVTFIETKEVIRIYLKNKIRIQK
jgi:hypothetical protein